jgi:hypothetical protein
MKVEALVTALDGAIHRNPDTGRELYTLIGVFQWLSQPPDRFVVYVDVRRGAEDDATLKIRIRKAGKNRTLLYESAEELVLAYASEAYATAHMIEEVRMPRTKVIIDVLIDGSIAASRLVDFSA